MRPYQISVCGDSAINIVVADTISAEASALVRSAAARIQAAGIAGIEDIVPTFCAVMVAYNPETISYEDWFRPCTPTSTAFPPKGLRPARLS